MSLATSVILLINNFCEDHFVNALYYLFNSSIFAFPSTLMRLGKERIFGTYVSMLPPNFDERFRADNWKNWNMQTKRMKTISRHCFFSCFLMAKMLACPTTFNFANKFFGAYARIRGCPSGVMIKAMDCGIVVSELAI